MSGYPHDCLLLEGYYSDSFLYPLASSMMEVKYLLNALKYQKERKK